MKILYISPENTVGTLDLWRKIHESHGNEMRAITFFPSSMGFPDDICLKLPLVSQKPWFGKLRNSVYRRTKGPKGENQDIPGNPPVWEPGSAMEKTFFAFRDWLWRFWVEPAIREYRLMDYDVYHFEWGMEFYRNGDFIRRIDSMNKPIFCTYHGQDMRNRGIIKSVDDRAWMRFTSEHDLMNRHPKLNYLFLPYDVAAQAMADLTTEPVTLCHATRSRYFKGSDAIIEACESLVKSHGARFNLIENQSHDVTMATKARSHIYIDQVSNIAPGYGMNSIEAMSMGLVCCTTMDEEYQTFLPDHPFINVSPENLREVLTGLVENRQLLIEKGQACREWVEKYHSLARVGDQLYDYYAQAGVEV